MKYTHNLNLEQLKYFSYFALGLLALLEIIFYKSGFLNVMVISLKLSLLVHLPGYLITLRIFKEDFEEIAKIFLGFALGLIAAALFYYLPSTLGVNVNIITYIVPIFLIFVGLGINISKKQPKIIEEKVEEKKKI